MPIIEVKGFIGSSVGTARETEFLTDTGPFYTLLPPGLARELGITPTVATRVPLADSRTAEIGVGIAYLRVLDREAAVPVGVMEVPVPLLGVTALEGLGLKVDPVKGELEPTRPFGPAALSVAGTNQR